MNFKNIKQLNLNYFSGAKDFIPTKYLKDVKIVGDSEGGSDGGGGGGGEDSGSIADKAFKMIRTSNADGILYGGQFYPNDDNIKPIIESLYTYRDNHEDFAILYSTSKYGQYDLIGQNKKFIDSYGDFYYLPIIASVSGEIIVDIGMNNIMDPVMMNLYINWGYIEINEQPYEYVYLNYKQEEYDVDLSFLNNIVLFTEHYENVDVNITPLSILGGGGDSSNDAILWINSILGKDYSMVKRGEKNLYGTYLKIQNVVTYQQLLDFINNVCTSIGYDNYIGQLNVDVKLKGNSNINKIYIYNDTGASGIHIGLAGPSGSITLTINKNHPNDLIFTFNNGIDFAYGFYDEEWPDPQYLTRVLIGSNNIDNAYLDNGITPTNYIYAYDSQDERQSLYPVNGHYVGDTYEFDIVDGIINNLTAIVP